MWWTPSSTHPKTYQSIGRQHFMWPEITIIVFILKVVLIVGILLPVHFLCIFVILTIHLSQGKTTYHLRVKHLKT